ncbi:MAG: glycosyltransferase family 92 protein [Holosporaceae bacterium]
MWSLLLGANVTDRRFLRYFLVFLLVVACAVGGVFLAKAWRARSKRLSLYAAAQPFFDANYYRTTYALGALGDQQAFEHYMTQGYKDLRNPSADFDATFYERLYLADYAGKVHGARQNPLLHYVRCGKTQGALMHQKFIKKAVPLLNPKYYLCVAAIFRDEARFLKEWIEYYLMMGVEHFYLTNHLSEDNYMEVLQPYIDKGLVTLRHETQEVTGDYSVWRSIQSRAFTCASDALAKKTEWLLLVDTDEYVVPYHKDSFAEFLRDYDDFAAVAIQWKTFGAGAVEEVKPDELSIEKLVMGKPDDAADLTSGVLPNVNVGIKSVIKPRYASGPPMDHVTPLQPGFVLVNGDKKPIQSCCYMLPISDSQVRLFHYRMRDLKFCREVKMPRYKRLRSDDRNVWKELESHNHLLSVKEDKRILRFVPELKRRMGLS